MDIPTLKTGVSIRISKPVRITAYGLNAISPFIICISEVGKLFPGYPLFPAIISIKRPRPTTEALRITPILSALLISISLSSILPVFVLFP